MIRSSRPAVPFSAMEGEGLSLALIWSALYWHGRAGNLVGFQYRAFHQKISVIFFCFSAGAESA